MTRELLLALHDAQMEAAAAVGLRGDAALRAMHAERKRREDERWAWIAKHARKQAAKRVSEDDYRSRVPEDAGENEASETAAGSSAVEFAQSSETGDGGSGCDCSAGSDESGDEAQDG